MSDNGHRAVVARFLGDAEAAGGPFALLGIPIDSCTQELVLGALERQIARINDHPEGETPEADEVRLALHAAAAQLLDPMVRYHMLRRWGGAPGARIAEAMRRSGRGLSLPARSADHAAQVRQLEHDALLTFAMFGGWNKRSLRRLASVAHARGLSSRELAHVLRTIAQRRAGGRQMRSGGVRTPPEPRREPPPSHPEPPLPEQVDPLAGRLRVALVLLAVATAAVAILALVLWALQRAGPDGIQSVRSAEPSEPVRTHEREVSEDTSAAVPAGAADTGTPAGTAKSIDTARLVSELRACVEGLQVDPQSASARFVEIVAALAADWWRLPPDEHAAAQHSVIEFVYLHGTIRPGDPAPVRAIAAGAAPLSAPRSGPAPGEVMPAVWSIGMLTRLLGERDLASPTVQLLTTELGAAMPRTPIPASPTFKAGAVAVLGVLPERFVEMMNQPEADSNPEQLWDQWWNAVEAVSVGDAPMRDRLLLAGLERLFVDGPEPDQDRSTYGVISAITPMLGWEPGAQARSWLVRWLGDPLVSAADLHTMCSALVTKVRPAGTDLSMVPSSRASMADREELRLEYTEAWAMNEPAPRGLALGELNEAVQPAMDVAQQAATPLEAFSSAVRLSYLNGCAEWLWRGDPAEAVRVLSGLDAMDLEIPESANQPLDTEVSFADARRDESWAERYLAAERNIPVRLDLLAELRGAKRPIGVVGADLLASEAVLGTPAEIRRDAREVIALCAERPHVINALLEVLPRAPRIASNSQLIASMAGTRLPPVDNPDWPIAARRALVERLLELLAGEGPLATIDRFSGLLARSYQLRAARVPLSDAARAEAAPPPEESIALLWNRWRRAADRVVPFDRTPFTLAELDRRRLGREGLADGLVQEFAATQVSLAELMAYTVAAERPAAVDTIVSIMDELSDRRRRAGHVFEQINAAELAMLRLWTLRLAREAPA